MHNLDPIYCPKCKLGFAPDTRFCPGCKIELSSKSKNYGDTEGPVDIEDNVAALALLRIEGAAWIRRLQEGLDNAGIRYRAIATEQESHRLSLYVRREDFQRASRIDHEVYKLEVPGTAELRHTGDLDFAVCPGCGDALGERDRECRSCGLRMAGAELRCSNCDEVLDREYRNCPYCGAAIR
ncbi:MAG: zinc ribbon domain-containing protein [Deltaproteobacteria bacterium]|nr:zinc ribbon domain-containing protein [Deltaproteobacteria bacterium]